MTDGLDSVVTHGVLLTNVKDETLFGGLTLNSVAVKRHVANQPQLSASQLTRGVSWVSCSHRRLKDGTHGDASALVGPSVGTDCTSAPVLIVVCTQRTRLVICRLRTAHSFSATAMNSIASRLAMLVDENTNRWNPVV